MERRRGVSQSPALLRATVTICAPATFALELAGTRRQAAISRALALARCRLKAALIGLHRTSGRSGAMRRIKTFLLIILPVSIAFVAPLRPARCIAPPQAPGHQLVVRSGANDEESLFSSEKLGKALFIMLPFAWGVVDWAHPPWYDVVLDAFRG